MTRTRSAFLLSVSVLLASSCVSQQRYDEALQEARYYQRMYQDTEPMSGELEAEIARLKGQLALYEADQPLEAKWTEPIDEKLAELERIAQGLGTAPGDVTVLQVEGGYGYRLSDAVLFASGSADVTADGQAVLQKLAADINSRPYQRVWIRGHTDTDPIVKEATKERFPTNLHLSAARSLSVAMDLIGDGIPSSKVVVAGFGPSDPVAGNTSADGKRQNRRVEIFVIEDGATAYVGDK
jgi:flagellar motor protein MotB